MRLTNIKKIQNYFVVIGITYVLFLVATIVWNSIFNDRIFLTNINTGGSGSDLAGRSGELKNDNLTIHLQDFYRTELKGTEKKWEIKASDAQHDMSKGLTRVQGAEVTIYRNDGNVTIDSITTTIFSDKDKKDKVKKLDAEGNVRVRNNSGMTITSNIATFSDTLNEISTPAYVKIEGNGYEISGVGLTYNIATDVVRVLSLVDSRFEFEKE